MNATQLHLALTHVPVVLSIIGLVILIISFFRKSDTLTKTALWILLAAGVFTLPVYFTGEGTEEVVEGLPGVSEVVIEKHEDFAKATLVLVSASGLLALIGLLAYSFGRAITALKVLTLLLAFVSAGAMAQTAHLGGQIRHSEIRTGALAQGGEAGGNQNEGGEEGGSITAGEDSEEDD
ncbi:MAG TPA: hypothetical protein VGE66_12175 [Chitinophagaceae bacterium]